MSSIEYRWKWSTNDNSPPQTPKHLLLLFNTSMSNKSFYTFILRLEWLPNESLIMCLLCA